MEQKQVESQRVETLIEKQKRLQDELKNVEDELRTNNTKEAWNLLEHATTSIDLFEKIMQEYPIGAPIKKSISQFRVTAQELHNFVIMVAERKI